MSNFLRIFNGNNSPVVTSETRRTKQPVKTVKNKRSINRTSKAPQGSIVERWAATMETAKVEPMRTRKTRITSKTVVPVRTRKTKTTNEAAQPELANLNRRGSTLVIPQYSIVSTRGTIQATRLSSNPGAFQSNTQFSTLDNRVKLEVRETLTGSSQNDLVVVRVLGSGSRTGMWLVRREDVQVEQTYKVATRNDIAVVAQKPKTPKTLTPKAAKAIRDDVVFLRFGKRYRVRSTVQQTVLASFGSDFTRDITHIKIDGRTPLEIVSPMGNDTYVFCYIVGGNQCGYYVILKKETVSKITT